MSKALEIVRFRVDPAREAAFLASRPAAIAALRAGVPGFLAAYLGRIEGDRWVDVLEWESREAAVAAAEAALQIPAFADWASCIAEIETFEHADVERED